MTVCQQCQKRTFFVTVTRQTGVTCDLGYRVTTAFGCCDRFRLPDEDLLGNLFIWGNLLSFNLKVLNYVDYVNEVQQILIVFDSELYASLFCSFFKKDNKITSFSA